jgi:hypothetical protein
MFIAQVKERAPRRPSDYKIITACRRQQIPIRRGGRIAGFIVHGVQQRNLSQGHLLVVVWLSGAPCVEVLKRPLWFLRRNLQTLHTQNPLRHLARRARRDHVSSYIGIRTLQRGLPDGHRRAAHHRRAHKERGKNKWIEQPPEHPRLSLLASPCRQLHTSAGESPVLA